MVLVALVLYDPFVKFFILFSISFEIMIINDSIYHISIVYEKCIFNSAIL